MRTILLCFIAWVATLFLVHAQPVLAASPKPGANTVTGQSVNVVDYGADPTGQKDSAAAFERAFAAAIDSRHVQLVLPPGRFLLKSAVHFVVKGNTWCGLTLQGAGEGTTELAVDNSEGGLVFEGVNTNRVEFHLKDFSLLALREGAGTAVKCVKPNPGVKHVRQFTAENVEVRGESFDKGFFDCGFELHNLWFPYLWNVTVADRYGPKLPKVRKRMSYGIHLLDCYNPKLIRCHIWGSETALASEAENGGPEDGEITGSYFVDCTNGILWRPQRNHSKWGEPALHITDCHINYRDKGLVLEGVREASVTNCLFFCHDSQGSPFFGGGTPRNFTPVDVDLVYANDIILTGNIFTEPSNPRRIAIRISKDSGFILISGNQFNLEGTAIRNESPRPSFSEGNFFHGRRNFSQGLVKYQDVTGTLVKQDLN